MCQTSSSAERHQSQAFFPRSHCRLLTPLFLPLPPDSSLFLSVLQPACMCVFFTVTDTSQPKKHNFSAVSSNEAMKLVWWPTRSLARSLAGWLARPRLEAPHAALPNTFNGEFEEWLSVRQPLLQPFLFDLPRERRRPHGEGPRHYWNGPMLMSSWEQ